MAITWNISYFNILSIILSLNNTLLSLCLMTKDVARTK